MAAPSSRSVTRRSSHTFAATVLGLSTHIARLGCVLFATIDQSSAAQAVGLSLRPTTVLLFGNPKAGSPLMQEHPAFALVLPLQIVVWEEDGVRVTFPVMAQLARDHGLAEDDPRIAAMDRVLDALADSLS
jgi:uncharacterized protein (DUF302 family)